MRAAAGIVDQFVPGTMLGKYELLATIGTGGMANVILARQHGPAGFEKVVVVKVVHPHMSQDQVAVNMLLDEAKVAAQIDHHNVVHTYELGEAAGTFYIVMEYLAGESLGQVIKLAKAGEPPPLAPFLAARIVADAATGLHFAHELADFSGRSLEVVHRDVSPGNIVVLYNGAVKVVDFGIAKAHGRVTSTQDGELKGKYGYMSPEQIKNEPMDRRSDVFSLGVVMWEALAQRRLFQADNVAAILMQILGGERLPPSHYQPGIPAALDAIVLRALAPDPAHRFQTAGEMKTAIEDVIWQSRYGATEISAHMTALFADRIEQRRALLARATRDQLSQHDFASFGAAFRDPASGVERRTATPYPPTPYPAAPYPGHAAGFGPATVVQAPLPPPASNRTVPIILGCAIAVGILAGVLATRGDRSAHSPGADRPVVATDASAPATPAKPAEPSLKEAMTAAEPTVRVPTIRESAAGDPADTATSPTDAGSSLATRPTDAAPSSASNMRKLDGSRQPTKPEVAKPEAAKPETAKRETASPRRSAADDLNRQATEQYLAGKFAAAEDLYRQAIAANRSFAPAYRGLGFLYQRTGNTAKAIEALRTYLRLSPRAKDVDAVEKRLAALGAEP